MKYGRLVFGRNCVRGNNQYGNLGDCYQSYAVDNLYDYMGISRSDRSLIKRTEITDYRGELTLLPLQGCFIRIKGAPVFPVSPDIWSVFFGFHGMSVADRRHIRALPAETVIGCRDEPTYMLMNRLGKRAFLTGCLTMALPRRTKEPENGRVFLVDAPDGIEAFMPERLRKKTEYISQSFFLDNGISEDETYKSLDIKAGETLARYRDEASLIVTSRLHVAAPCTAMGIPVILARNYFDVRYSWMEKFLPLYTPDMFRSIDWDFKAPDIEDVKKIILDAAASMINETADRDGLLSELHEYYMDRSRAKIKTPLYTRAYHFMQGVSPKTADYVREVMLPRFTVETSRNKHNVNSNKTHQRTKG